MESPAPGHHRRRPRPCRRGRPLRAAFVCAVLVGVTATGTAYLTARTGSARTVSGAVSSPSAPAPAPTGTSGRAGVEAVREPVAGRTALLATAMGSVPVAAGAAVSVAVLDLDSGQGAGYGDGVFETASVVKVDILAALLLQAQDAGRRLTARERTYATAMIEDSDNDSASALWRSIGEAGGLDAANRRFGLTATSGGDGTLWGLTRTTSADQLALLKQVFGRKSKLSAASRAYLQGLMGGVADDQDWGVSAAADGSAWALKNGWLPRSTTGLWVVNSIGRVTVGGDDYLVAALSHGNATKEAGISLVEASARAAVSVFTTPAAAAARSAAPSAPSSAAPSSSTAG
ncbi:serine hydrolase [Streptomyces sp. NPDC021356]|uniref:serine hydrolase n=1 Tax=Streptomyces sp. NPDC021356 TaxID=3154900 RepID=UPI0033F70F53